MSKEFSIIFNDFRGDRIEAAAARLGVKPEQMLVFWVLDKLREVEGKTTNKEFKK